MNWLLALLLLAAPAAEDPSPVDPPAGLVLTGISAQPGLEAAVAAYREGHYAQAAEEFARLAAAETDPGRAGVLHCNAGTAAARSEQLGEALWQLMRARTLLPRDPQTAANLERVQALLAVSRAASAETATDSPVVTRTLLALPLHATLDETGTVCALIAALALLLLALQRLGLLPRVLRHVALALLLAALAWWLFARMAWDEEGRRAVVIPASVNGRAEPTAASETLFHFASGTVLASEQQRGDWRLVQADNGARGWVPADQVRPLR